MVRSAGPVVAGSPTTRYEASRDGHAVERVYVQRDSGLVLRREVLGADGDVLRSVSFMRMQERADEDTTSSTTAPKPGPQPVDNFERPYHDPARAGDGFRLVGRWQHANDLAQLYYSDGVLSVSVFEQPGHLDWSTLPEGGVAAEVNGRPALRYTLPVGEAWVFERGGVVYTFVGDASAAELARSRERRVAARREPRRTSRADGRRPVQVVGVSRSSPATGARNSSATGSHT